MATRLRMYYNPYLCNVKMFVLSQNGTEKPIDGTARDMISSMFKERFCLEDDGEELLKILLDSYRGSEIKIDFVGTERNYKWFSKICLKYSVEITESESERILTCDEINKIIVDKVKKLKTQGFDIDSNGEIDKILDATIPVIVVGNMSAGKSTFLNAIIGEELLSSGQNRTTGVNCALHNSAKEIKAEYFIDGKKVTIDCVNINKSKNKRLIPEELISLLDSEKRPINRVRCVIDFFNNSSMELSQEKALMLDDKLIEVFCPFHNNNIPEQIVFYDTPGVDSDTYKEDAKTLRKVLSDQTKGFLIFVCSERKELDKAKDLIDTVQETTDNKLDLAHTIVVCNATEYEPDKSVLTTVEMEWDTRIIYASSAVALGARKPKSDDNPWRENRLKSTYYNNINAFSNPSYPCYISLPRYCTLPDNRLEDVPRKHEQLKEELNKAIDVELAQKELIEFNSGIGIIEQEIIYVANELFPYNQCERARKAFLKLLEEYNDKINKKEIEKKKCKSERIKEFNMLYEPLCNMLLELTNTFVPKMESLFTMQVNESDYKWTEFKADMFATQVIDNYLNRKYYESHSEKEIRQEIVKLLNTDIKNVTERVENDFNNFMLDTAIPKYTEDCIEIINSQNAISESEKEVFRDFFKKQRLVDETANERKKALDNVELSIPDLQKKLGGDKWYTKAWKTISNAGKEAKYWAQKNFVGDIKKDLVNCHSAQYTVHNDNLLNQTKTVLNNIFNMIKEEFYDHSAENNVICKLNPDLNMMRNEIQELSIDINELEKKKRIISIENDELKNIFQKTK